MKIEYVCHSCLYIDTGDTTILFDPWFNGPAYKDQWHVFPKPVDTSMLPDVKNIIYSHGHEDHLHDATLSLFSNKTSVFFPYQWRSGVNEYFEKKGYRNLTEAISFKKYRLSPTTQITYIGFALESIIVVEVGSTVIVNLNDALNSHHQNVVNLFLAEITKRWPKIHYLFSGWSGAGYFPNMVHYAGKDDEETGRLREQYFCNHFCKIVKVLQPDHAIPFAPGFVLLKPEQRWINNVKFPREMLEKYYSENFESDHNISFPVMHPGDRIVDGKFKFISPWHEAFKRRSLDEIVEEVYADEIKLASIVIPATDALLDTLPGIIEDHLNNNMKLYPREVLKDVRFSLFFRDSHRKQYHNVDFDGNKFNVSLSLNMPVDRNLRIRTTTDLLLFAIDNEWGGDALTIGYGLDVDVFNESSLEKNLDIICVRLLTSYPTASEHLKAYPFRAAKYFFTHPVMAKLLIKQKLQFRNAINKFPYNERDHWISYSKCELCKVCDMPMLSHEFGESLQKTG